MACRICLEDGDSGELLTVCNCSGSCQYVHQQCLQQWIDVSHHTHCEICQAPYTHTYVSPSRPSTNAQASTIDKCPCVVLTTVTCALIHAVLIVLESWRGYAFVYDMLVLCILFNAYHVTIWCIATNFHIHTGIVSGIWLLSFVVGLAVTSFVLETYHSDIIMALIFNLVVAVGGLLVPCFIGLGPPRQTN